MLVNIKYMLVPKYNYFHSFPQYCSISLFPANLSLYTSGLGVGWNSPVIVKLQDENNPVYEKPITDNEASLIVSLGLIGGITGKFVIFQKVNYRSTYILSIGS